MQLKLSRPLVILKVHATGPDPRADRVGGITIDRRDPDGKRRQGTRLINPERPIPASASSLHGITDEKVQAEKTFQQVGKQLFDFIADADVAGFGVKTDIEMLAAEFQRLGMEYTVHNRDVIDLHDIYVKLNPRNFTSAVTQYLGAQFLPDGPIGTEEHARLSAALMEQMLKPLGDDLAAVTKKLGLQRTLDIRGWFVLDQDKRAIFNVGKHKGTPVAQALLSDDHYYQWMLSAKADIPRDVLDWAERIVKKAKSAQTA